MSTTHQTVSINAIEGYIDEHHSTRSAWKRGVHVEAIGMCESLRDYGEAISPDTGELERMLLHGAESVRDAVESGCYLVYDEDICRRYATPSEQRRTDYGRLYPNGHESWLDVECQGVSQAIRLIKHAAIRLSHDHAGTAAEA